MAGLDHDEYRVLSRGGCIYSAFLTFWKGQCPLGNREFHGTQWNCPWLALVRTCCLSITTWASPAHHVHLTRLGTSSSHAPCSCSPHTISATPSSLLQQLCLPERALILYPLGYHSWFSQDASIK